MDQDIKLGAGLDRPIGALASPPNPVMIGRRGTTIVRRTGIK